MVGGGHSCVFSCDSRLWIVSVGVDQTIHSSTAHGFVTNHSARKYENWHIISSYFKTAVSLLNLTNDGSLKTWRALKCVYKPHGRTAGIRINHTSKLHRTINRGKTNFKRALVSLNISVISEVTLMPSLWLFILIIIAPLSALKVRGRAEPPTQQNREGRGIITTVYGGDRGNINSIKYQGYQSLSITVSQGRIARERGRLGTQSYTL